MWQEPENTVDKVQVCTHTLLFRQEQQTGLRPPGLLQPITFPHRMRGQDPP